MEKRQHTAPPFVGGTSLLVIFATLCLIIFALLSLSTTRADERLGDSMAQAVSDYYAADCQAESVLAQLRQGTVPAGVSAGMPVVGGSLYTYSCPVSDTQELVVEVLLNGEDYQILRWQAVSTADWQPDESLPVWTGN